MTILKSLQLNPVVYLIVRLLKMYLFLLYDCFAYTYVCLLGVVSGPCGG